MIYFFLILFFFLFTSRRRHTISKRDWSSDVCSFHHARSRHVSRDPERAPRRTPGRSRDDARYLLRAVRARDTLGARALARADAFGERVSCPQVGGRALSDVARVRVAPRRDPRRRRRVVVVRARRDRLPPERAGRGVSAPLPIRGGHDEQRPEPEGRRVLP